MSNNSNIEWKDKFFTQDIVEKALIAYLLRNPNKFVQFNEKITKNMFTNEGIQYIFTILKLLNKEGRDWNWHIVADTISKIEDRPVSLEYPKVFISEIVSEAVSDKEHVDLYMNQLLEVDSRKSVYDNIENLKLQLTDPTKSLSSILGLLKKFESDIMRHHRDDISREVKKENVLDFFMSTAKEIASAKFVGTGFPSIDQHLAWGFYRTHISAISGRPNIGKSLLRGHIQSNLYDIGVPNILISREQNLFSEIARQIAQIGEIPLMTIIRTAQWLNDESLLKQITGVLDYMQRKWPIHLIEPFGLYCLTDIKHAVIDAKSAGMMPHVVFVDLFAQLDDVGVVDNQAQVIQQKVIEAANLAKEIKFHMCMVVQQRRGNNDDPNEGLKGSGGYEERVDLHLSCDRPGKNSETVEDNIFEVEIAKQRDGVARKKVNLDFDGPRLKIRDIGLKSNEDEVESFKGSLGLGRKENQNDQNSTK